MTGWPLSAWLLVFGGCLVVPALGFSASLIERHWAQQQRGIEQGLRQVAIDLAYDVDRFLETTTATLSVIADSSDFSPARLPRLHEQASQWLAPLGLYLVYRDAGGRQLMNTRVPWGTKLPDEQLPEIDAAVRASSKPEVSNVFRGAVAGQPIVAVTAPVRDGDGRIAGFLHLSINPTVLLHVARGQNLPAQWNTAISDRRGAIIVMLHDHQKFVGTSPPREVGVQSRADGRAYRIRDADGIEQIRVSALSRASGWVVSASVPVEVARAPLVAEMWTVMGAGLLMLGLTLALALAVAAFIARPIRSIADLAGTVEGEQVTAVLQSPIREANEVSAALHLASQRLHERTQTLRQTLDRFDVALRGADIVVFAQDREQRLVWASDSSRSFPAEILGRDDRKAAPGEQRSEAVALGRLALVSGRPQDREVKVGQGDTVRHFRVRIEPMKDAGGEIVGLLGVSSEVTSLKRSEARNAFLVAELAHRSKNLLAVVQSIATETLRSGSPESFAGRFAARVRALATLQDLMLSGQHSGVELSRMAHAQLEPFLAAGAERLTIDGPQLRLGSTAANALGLALHELATNAAKYGALSRPAGRVRLAWSLASGREGERRFRMRWQESGGPVVAPPGSRGFGHQVMVDMTSLALQAEVLLDFRAAGVVWQVDAPAEAIESVADRTS